MTNNSFDKFRDVGSPLSDWTIPAEDGVHRRTIVKGAAWTIPVVAVSVATPAAAASKTPTLAFTKASYTGTACSTITGVQVKRTTDGTTPDPGKTVTVTLKDGYTFADGSTTYTGTTDANGLVTLPDIKVPSTGGKSNFAAKSDALTTNAPVSADPSKETGLYLYNFTDGSTTGPVANSGTAIKTISSASGGGYVFQNSDGSIHSSDGTVVPGTETGVDTGDGLVTLQVSGGETTVYYKKADGVYSYNFTTKKTSGPITDTTTNTSSKTATKLISNAGGSAFVYQSSDGSIRNSGGGLVPGTSTGVSTDQRLTSLATSDGTTSLYYKKSDGVYIYNFSTKTTTGPIANSKDATSLISDAGSGAFVFQTSDGSIYNSTGVLVKGTDTGVDTGAGLVTLATDAGKTYVYYKKADGVYRYNFSDGTTTGPIESATADSKSATTLVSDGATGAFVYQSSDGTIRNSGAGIVKGTEKDVIVDSKLVSLYKSGSTTYASYKKSPACK
ncbi:hypothetical protein C5C18_10900 [Rathayibacter tritici]|uniref:Uncharacterized protein n=1 Tax=Rathayibacter tritici TaxID=33888 RepID=A0A160KPT8_9MICO|nr:hypothetical protein [Rathayibacter tritici]AND15486.1 hypothetical protein A6122_0326 [Rathayibacter tritici]PPF26254.1 hypothetical protein C5C06_11820 [Rathayibacter tritici]PPF63986.1 hypothetical protein C5C21_12550 [Rathayibacter tritici]PPG06210.1 hypothetical protein C5C18_10900 [Rathayibacter tritici]PPI17239.1 hypothetical protein C5D07_05120 [Rathayibacter tritici]